MIDRCASPLHIRNIALRDWYVKAHHSSDTALVLGILEYAIFDQVTAKVDLQYQTLGSILQNSSHVLICIP